MFKPSFKRKSIRLSSFDYNTGGFFFITICIKNNKCTLGTIKDFEMVHSEFGKLVQKQWKDTESEKIDLHQFLVMPNHFHAIVKLNNYPLSKLIGEFKSITTRIYINGVKEKKWKPFDKILWQRNYFEHIIKNEKSHHKIVNYIENNPAKWHEDKFFKS